jgi:tetratricopeptide (TPR) repeat protein
MTIMLSIASWVLYQRGDRAAARDCGQQLVALAEALGFVAWVDDGLAVLACVEVQNSTEEARLSEVYRRLTTSRARAAWRNVIALCLVAEGYGKIGEAGKGLEALGAILEDHRGILCAPEIQRLRGHLLLSRGESVEAEGCLRRAIELAQRRDEKSFELRAATSLARLLDGQGKRDEARALLDALA